MKEYIKATREDADQIFEIVQESIRSTYPKYYPMEVVDFFCEHHCMENIINDIDEGIMGILMVDGKAVGTGCYRDNNIERVYVRSECQGKGYGSYIMDLLEEIIAKDHSVSRLDASLPASHLYEKRGYKTITHNKIPVENGVFLVFEIMEKVLY